eukprot:scaffold30462_cov28-Tisochrysis_lutea.AAC.9
MPPAGEVISQTSKAETPEHLEESDLAPGENRPLASDSPGEQSPPSEPECDKKPESGDRKPPEPSCERRDDVDEARERSKSALDELKPPLAPRRAAMMQTLGALPSLGTAVGFGVGTASSAVTTRGRTAARPVFGLVIGDSKGSEDETLENREAQRDGAMSSASAHTTRPHCTRQDAAHSSPHHPPHPPCRAHGQPLCAEEPALHYRQQPVFPSHLDDEGVAFPVHSSRRCRKATRILLPQSRRLPAMSCLERNVAVLKTPTSLRSSRRNRLNRSDYVQTAAPVVHVRHCPRSGWPQRAHAGLRGPGMNLSRQSWISQRTFRTGAAPPRRTLRCSPLRGEPHYFLWSRSPQGALAASHR